MNQSNAVRRRSSRIERLCLGPYSAWALLFIVVPLLFVAYYAFTDNPVPVHGDGAKQKIKQTFIPKNVAKVSYVITA